VVRNRRFQTIGTVSLLAAIGFIVLLVVVIKSPGQSFDHPGGFTSGGRVLAAIGCLIAAASFGVYGIAGLRVALIVDDQQLVIRNPYRTTKVSWASKPKFEPRDRRQEVVVSSPTRTSMGGGPGTTGTVTYRYREIVCVADRKRIWIAATARMTNRDRVDQMLTQLRQASGNRNHKAAAAPEASD